MATSSFRIVSLCPSNTELLFALGLGPYVVGVDQYSDYPSEGLDGLVRLGPDLHIDIETVIGLKPDLVVSSLSVPGMERVVEAVGQAGLQQLTLSSSSFQGMLEDLRRIEVAVPCELLVAETADRLIASLESRLSRLCEWTKMVAWRPRLYWEWWPNPVFSPAKENWLTELSEYAGAVNIFGAAKGHQVKDDGSRVWQAHPDVMLAVWTGVPQHKVPLQKILSRETPWQETPAFKQGEIYILSEGLFCRPSPRLVDGLEQLVGLLHPAAVTDLGLRSPASYAPVRLRTGAWLEA